MNEFVFSLDIGTQSVTGVLLKQHNTTYEVIDYCIKEHSERSMLDGQIHNIVQVADVITQVKNTLEEKHGKLNKVCVAAAGRALKTVQAEIKHSIKERPISNIEEIKHLELSAVQNAQATLLSQDENTFSKYHCVGYSVLHYKLDDDIIGSLIDQTGEKITIEVIATFLPEVVVKSLLAALDRADLIMEALTLEPIAAIDVLIPDSMRKLNVALIDIGAGTSDIAITKHGTVIGYSMVPVAGDEITEAISNEYILDFKDAEQAKQDVVNNKKATIQDILGFESVITYDELTKKIAEPVKKFSKLLAHEILALNGKSPQAIMLIGGGSMTPQLSERIAEAAQIPHNRVGVRGIEAIRQLETNDNLPHGPDFVTPIGIAISATNNPIHYINIYVNDTNIRMFEMRQLTVGDCLIQAGIDINKLYGKPGLAVFAKVNGEDLVLRGEYGEAPTIYLNDKPCTVHDDVKFNDHIVIKKGKDGENSHYSIADVVGNMPMIPFYLNREEKILKPKYYVNGQESNVNHIIKDNENIDVKLTHTIEDLITLGTISSDILQKTKPMFIHVNDKKIKVKNSHTQLLLNNKPVDLNAEIKRNDQLVIEYAQQPTVKTILRQLNKLTSYTITVYFNNQPVQLSQQRLIIKRQDVILEKEDLIFENDELTIDEQQIQPFIFQDIFRFVDIDLAEIKGDYQVYRNGEVSSFDAPIEEHDKLAIE